MPQNKFRVNLFDSSGGIVENVKANGWTNKHTTDNMRRHNLTFALGEQKHKLKSN